MTNVYRHSEVLSKTLLGSRFATTFGAQVSSLDFCLSNSSESADESQLRWALAEIKRTSTFSPSQLPQLRSYFSYYLTNLMSRFGWDAVFENEEQLPMCILWCPEWTRSTKGGKVITDPTKAYLVRGRYNQDRGSFDYVHCHHEGEQAIRAANFFIEYETKRITELAKRTERPREEQVIFPIPTEFRTQFPHPQSCAVYFPSKFHTVWKSSSKGRDVVCKLYTPLTVCNYPDGWEDLIEDYPEHPLIRPLQPLIVPTRHRRQYHYVLVTTFIPSKSTDLLDVVYAAPALVPQLLASVQTLPLIHSDLRFPNLKFCGTGDDAFLLPLDWDFSCEKGKSNKFRREVHALELPVDNQSDPDYGFGDRVTVGQLALLLYCAYMNHVGELDNVFKFRKLKAERSLEYAIERIRKRQSKNVDDTCLGEALKLCNTYDNV